MQLFVQVVVQGLGAGAIYASLALALVIIYRSTGVVNFAQGEMALMGTYFAWQMIEWGAGVRIAIAVALVASFLGGAVIERTVIRPVEGGEPLNIIIVTLGLFLAFNGVVIWIWSAIAKAFPSPVPQGAFEVATVRLSKSSLSLVVILVLEVLLIWAFFQFTRVGLAIRAAALEPEPSRLAGIPVGRMLMMGWGLAAAIGTFAGTLVAHDLFLTPTLMLNLLVYAFAAATLGGFESPSGAVVGGLLVGVIEALTVQYVDFVGSQLRLGVALFVIVFVLLVRPQGLFGRVVVARV
jgi:branched-chain amino acid transport system permease protein